MEISIKLIWMPVKRAVAAGIIVCRASRTPSGRVVLHDEINDDELGT
jgi:L-asparaginase